MSDEDNNEANQEVDPADEGRFVARCRGLPWSTTVDEIKNFFSKCRFKDGKFIYQDMYFLAGNLVEYDDYNVKRIITFVFVFQASQFT